MERRDNYQIQMDQAKRHFLTYDQAKLVEKLKLKADDTYIYANLLCQPYRLHRTTANLERLCDGEWADGNSYQEVMTLLDLVCDSREDRFLTGRWKNMSGFGLQFHQHILEDKKDPTAEMFDRDPDGLRKACVALGGREISGCDIGYAIELFDGLEIGLQFWHGDDEFNAQLRYLWDENALQYIRYETMFFAVGLLLRRIRERMG